MSPEQADAFARAWIDAWNRNDIEAVLAHYAPDGSFVSPTALAVTGHAAVRGVDALRTYWSAALARHAGLRFELDYALCDPARNELCVVYRSTVGGQTTRACEFMRFDAAGRITHGEAMYGIPVSGA